MLARKHDDVADERLNEYAFIVIFQDDAVERRDDIAQGVENIVLRFAGNFFARFMVEPHDMLAVGDDARF